MSFYERLKSLAEEKNKSFNQIERELNYPRNALNAYKNKKILPQNVLRRLPNILMFQ